MLSNKTVHTIQIMNVSGNSKIIHVHSKETILQINTYY